MTTDEWQELVGAIRAAWPRADFGEEQQSAYYAALADLPYTAVRASLVRAAGESSDSLPRVGDLLGDAAGLPAPSPAVAAPSDEDDFVITLGGSPSPPGDSSVEASAPAQAPPADAAAGASVSMSPRMRRLTADWEAVRSEFSGHPLVQVEPLGATPAEKYKVTYRLTGVALQGDKPVRTHHHECEIHLPAGYPREQPLVLPLTPIFHPNVSDRYCIADDWSAGEGLMDVITRLAKIIQYQSYNTGSPLDARAAYWADNNKNLFPIGHEQLGRGDINISLGE